MNKVVDRMKRIPVREQEASVRAKNFDEVCLGYDEERALDEASRCLGCKNPRCVSGCPVSIDIPGFISHVKEGDFEGAAKEIAKYSALPAVCGRVCPQESQCEGKCVLGIKGEPVAIGKLEKFTADWARNHNVDLSDKEESKGKKVAVIGSGPAGLTCAGDLAKKGYDVTIFEALHEAGGVLVYGIPEFRLPKEEVVKSEIENIKKLGVKIETNVVVGRTVTIDSLIEEEGFDAVFIGSGAGLPKFMGIPGENSNGVFSANEFLTRVNLMKAFKDEYHTPVKVGKKVAVVGGGNVAMDAARTALRLGAETHIVYRRSEVEMPARKVEINKAKEDGINFHFLASPIAYIGEETVNSVECIQMKLEKIEGERAKPVIIENSNFIIKSDLIIEAISSYIDNNLTKEIDTTSWGGIIVNEKMQTSIENVFAGGDCVNGPSLVVKAMKDGIQSAKYIDEYLKNDTN